MSITFNPFTSTIDYTSSSSSTPSSTETLTNKTIDADLNTISNIDNNEIKANAAIDVTKLADGTVDNSEFQALNGVTGSIQTQIDSKLPTSGGTMSGAINMNGSNLTGLPTPSANSDAVTKAYADGIAAGLVFYNNILDVDLIRDRLSTPPVILPTENEVYIIGSSPTGDWTGLAGHAVYYDTLTSTWIDVLGRAVQTGDRFGVAMEYSSNSIINGDPIGTHDNQIVEIINATPGAITYTFTTPQIGRSVAVTNELSTHFGHAYNWNGTNWTEFLGPGAIVAGRALDWTANTLDVQIGNGITVNGSNQLELVLDGSVAVSGDINVNNHKLNNVNKINNATTDLILSALHVNLNNSPLINAYIPNAINPNDPVNKFQLDAVSTASSGSVGDIKETSFSISNNQSSFVDITGFVFADTSVRSFKALASVEVFATSNLYQVNEITGIQKDGGWEISQMSTGDNAQVIFSITNLGQMQYISNLISGFTSGKIKFRAVVTVL